MRAVRFCSGALSAPSVSSSGVETSLNISEIVKDSSAPVEMTRNRRSQTAATVQSAGTTAPAFQVDASPGARPSSSARTYIQRSSLTDREFRGLHSEALVKSKSRLGAMLPPTRTAHDRALRHVQDSSPISMALSFRYRRYRS